MPMRKPRSPKRTLILGAAWAVSTRWSVKGLGLISTVVMARLLVPADYGIVAMAMLIVGLIEALLDFGAATSLLRKADVTRDDINSAWTLRLLQGCAVGLVLLTVSPLAAIYFQEPRVTRVLWILAACVVIGAASNMGLTLSQKQFNFSFEFRYNLICKSIGVVATVTAGYWLRDYRALVIGVSAGYLSGFLMSYWLHPYRPSWNTSKIPEIWAVTKWLLLAGVAGFILRKSDELIAARIGTTGEFGAYNVGSDLGQLPTAEVGPAMLKAFLPVLVSMKAGVDEVNAAVVKTLSAVNTVTLPMGFGFAAVALPATALVLGPAWSSAVPFVAAFAMVGALQSIQSPFNTLLLMRGYTKVQSQIVWLEFAVFLLAAIALVPSWALIGLVWARMAGSLVSIGASAWATRKHCGLPLLEVVKAVLRPLMGALLMYGIVRLLDDPSQSDAWRLALGVTSGMLTFSVWSTLSWVFMGRPEGLESTVFDHFVRSGK
jgi:lipopolysaccharide exporter